MCKHPEPLRNAVLRATAAGCRSPAACALAIHCRSEGLAEGQGRTAGTSGNACRLRVNTQQNTFQVPGIAASMRVAGRTALCIPSRPRQSHPQRWHQRAGRSALRLFGCLCPTSCASMTCLRTQPLHPGHGTSPQTCKTPPCAPAAPAAQGKTVGGSTRRCSSNTQAVRSSRSCCCTYPCHYALTHMHPDARPLLCTPKQSIPQRHGAVLPCPLRMGGRH